MLTYTPARKPGRLMPDLANYVTTQEAAVLLGYHVEHVRRMLREGDLKGRKVGYMWFVTKDSVEKYRKDTAGMEKFDPRRAPRSAV